MFLMQYLIKEINSCPILSQLNYVITVTKVTGLRDCKSKTTKAQIINFICRVCSF